MYVSAQEETVYVPTVIQQEYVQLMVEQVVEVPLSMMQGKAVRVPKIDAHERFVQQIVEHIVERVAAPLPKVNAHERFVHQVTEQAQGCAHGHIVLQKVEQVMEIFFSNAYGRDCPRTHGHPIVLHPAFANGAGCSFCLCR